MKSTHQTIVARALSRLLLCVLGLSFGLAGASAQSAATPAPAAPANATGTVSGLVTDATSKLTLSGVRVSVPDTALETYTDQQGHYSLPEVPAGQTTLTFSYVGYPALTLAVTVSPGETNLLNAVFGGADQIVTMSEFKITGDVVGTARSINEERAAPALTYIVAADAIGQLPDKNVAEALERIPGVDIARDKGEGRYVIIRGLDPEYVGISMNGIRMSTSEKGSREAALDTISSSMIASMDVNKVNTPDMDTDDMGGSVNIKTRTGFDQAGTQASAGAATNYSHQEDRKGGYNFFANFATSTLDNGKLGVAFDVSADDRPFTDYTEPSTGWTQVKSPTDGLLHWIDTSQDFRHYDAERWRDAMSTALDYKFSDQSKAWVRFFTTDYTERNNQWLTTFPFGSGTVQALTDTSATVSIKAAGLIKSEAQITNNKREQSMVGGYDLTSGTWTNHLSTAYTTGKYTRPTVTIAYANAAADVVTYNFNTPYNGTVAQVSGPSIDDPASFAFSTKSSFTQTTANMHEETVKDDLRDDFDVNNVPMFVQFGGEYRNKNTNENTFKEAITSTPLTLANEVFPGNDVQDTMGGFPSWRILPQAVQNFYQNQSAYGQTLTAATTYGGAFQALEDITAGYAMGGATFGKLKVMAGGRLEDTHFWISGWQVDSTTGVITPVAYTKNYANFLPTAIFTYEFTPQTIGRASWSNTLARPDYSGTVPGRTVDDVNHLVTQGNPQLDPLQAINWDASLEHYYSPLGVVSVAVFYKQIKNFAFQAQSGTDPATGYLLTTYFNGPSAWIYGTELNWAQRLSFLPAPLNGLGIHANVTLNDSQASYPTRPGESIPFAGAAKKAGNAAITYDYVGLHLQVAANYHGKRLESGSVIGANSTQDQYEDTYLTIDCGTSYTFKNHYQIYLNGANLNNAPLREYLGGTGSLQRIQTYEAYGWSAESGVRWNY